MADFETIRDAKNELVLADLHMAALFAPMSVPAIDTLEDVATGDIVTLTGYKSAGLIEKSAGVSLTNDTDSTDIEAYGDAEPVRNIVNKRTTKFQTNFLETNITTLEKFWGTSFANVIPSTHGGVVLEAPSLPKNTYYRCILFGQDDVNDSPLYTYYIMPKVKLESVDSQDLKDDGAVTYGLTFQAFRDSTVGFSIAQGWCGPGWTHLVSRAGFVAAPTSSLVVTAASGSLTGAAASSVQLKVVGNNGINYTPLASFVSADPTKVTVSPSGLATRIATGSASVTASYLPAGAVTALTGAATVVVS